MLRHSGYVSLSLTLAVLTVLFVIMTAVFSVLLRRYRRSTAAGHRRPVVQTAGRAVSASALARLQNAADRCRRAAACDDAEMLVDRRKCCQFVTPRVHLCHRGAAACDDAEKLVDRRKCCQFVTGRSPLSPVMSKETEHSTSGPRQRPKCRS